jgi:NAD(P)H dehydrogenase (quinone)
VQVREADYTKPATLATAFAGAKKLLLISSSEVGQRAPQHRNAIDAARAVPGLELVAYTSILRADTSPLSLAPEHAETETMLRAAGLPFVLLRNGWYSENYTGSVGAAVAHGAVIGSAGDGGLSTAARADYAEAAAAVLTAREPQAGKVYELAGDSAFTLAEFAAEIAKQSGRPVVYKHLSEADYKAALVGFGLPDGFAGVLAQCDAAAAGGALFDNSRTLSRLIGRPTTPMATSVSEVLKA